MTNTNTPHTLKGQILQYLQTHRDSAQGVARHFHAPLTDVREHIQGLLLDGELESTAVGHLEVFHAHTGTLYHLSHPQKVREILQFVTTHTREWVPITEIMRHLHPKKLNAPTRNAEKIIGEATAAGFLETNDYSRARITQRGTRWMHQ